jgi:hypothetical protein
MDWKSSDAAVDADRRISDGSMATDLPGECVAKTIDPLTKSAEPNLAESSSSDGDLMEDWHESEGARAPDSPGDTEAAEYDSLTKAVEPNREDSSGSETAGTGDRSNSEAAMAADSPSERETKPAESGTLVVPVTPADRGRSEAGERAADDANGFESNPFVRADKHSVVESFTEGLMLSDSRTGADCRVAPEPARPVWVDEKRLAETSDDSKNPRELGIVRELLIWSLAVNTIVGPVRLNIFEKWMGVENWIGLDGTKNGVKMPATHTGVSYGLAVYPEFVCPQAFSVTEYWWLAATRCVNSPSLQLNTHLVIENQ